MCASSCACVYSRTWAASFLGNLRRLAFGSVRQSCNNQSIELRTYSLMHFGAPRAALETLLFQDIGLAMEDLRRPKGFISSVLKSIQKKTYSSQWKKYKEWCSRQRGWGSWCNRQLLVFPAGQCEVESSGPRVLPRPHRRSGHVPTN